MADAADTVLSSGTWFSAKRRTKRFAVVSKMPNTDAFVSEPSVDLVSLDETTTPTARIFTMLVVGGVAFWVGLAGLLFLAI